MIRLGLRDWSWPYIISAPGLDLRQIMHMHKAKTRVNHVNWLTHTSTDGQQVIFYEDLLRLNDLATNEDELAVAALESQRMAIGFRP